jgi:hypothetical protein
MGENAFCFDSELRMAAKGITTKPVPHCSVVPFTEGWIQSKLIQ